MTNARNFLTVVFLFPINLNRLDYAGVLHDPFAAVVFCSAMYVDYTVITGKFHIKEDHIVTLDLPN